MPRLNRLAVLRLDGDLYEATIHTLDRGFCIIDDYHALKAREQAAADYREKHGISAEIVKSTARACCGKP